MHSLYFKLAGLLLAAVAVSGLFFVVINYAGEQMITKIFSDSSHIEKLSEAYIQDLQDYIDETKAASNDSEKLTEWVRKRKIVSIQVYKDEILTYDSNYPDAAVEDAERGAGVLRLGVLLYSGICRWNGGCISVWIFLISVIQLCHDSGNSPRSYSACRNCDTGHTETRAVYRQTES